MANVERVWFKPKHGKKVLVGPNDPGLFFPAEGALVVRDNWIERRLREGAGTIVDEPHAADDAAIAKAKAVSKK